MNNSPMFAAFLTPHRSLSRRGIHIVVAVYGALALIPSIFFFMSGAWPVVGFLGFDALVLWWALSQSLKSGKAFEEVTLWPDSLEIRHVTARGKEHNHAFNPFWVRLNVDKDFEGRTTRLSIKSRHEEVEIGQFLNPDDKASFATVFSQELSKARM